jgi:hypothetical protein
MTETEWLACTSPDRMLEGLRGRATDRKLRLFACHCCRRVWHLLKDERSRRAVEATELFAEGLTGLGEVQAAAAAARAVVTATKEPVAWAAAVAAWEVAAAKEAVWAAAVTAAATAEVVRAAAGEDSHEEVYQCAAIRDLFGNPFRPCHVVTGWLRWNSGAVVKAAEVIYRERQFENLPHLGELLEHAGCPEGAILRHCREPAIHHRGCWVVDAILGKK